MYKPHTIEQYKIQRFLDETFAILMVMAVVLAVWQALVYLSAFCFLLVQLSAL